MAKKMGRCKICRQWFSPSVSNKIPSHRIPTESGNGTEVCQGSNTEPVEKRGKW